MRFTNRLAARSNRALVFDDAPRTTRIGYIKGILPRFVGSSTGYGARAPTLDAYETHQSFIALVRDEADVWDYDLNDSWAGLQSHLKDCAWTEFFDFVELVGTLLIEKDDQIPFGVAEDFRGYRQRVNALLHEDGIGWILNEQSELRRQVPASIARRAQSTQAALKDVYHVARVHYAKAQDFLYQHPIDEGNCIKEMVSAIESVARVIAPKAKTLGDAIKHLRSDKRFSNHLMDSLEKIYVYSNATPLVRHGHVQGDRPLLCEAEMVFAAGVAFIRYLIDASATQPTDV